jgi:HK97 family phage major capsid protein
MTVAQDDLEKVVKSVEELRSEVTKSFPNIDKIEKINAFLDSYEKESQKIVAEKAQLKQQQLDLEEKISNLEVEVSRSSKANPNNYKNTSYYKALQDYCVKGEKALEIETKQTLRTDIDPQGGYLVPVELDNVIVKKIVEISPIRSIARVRTTAGKTLDVPVRNTIPTASYEGEAEQNNESNSTYQSESFTPYRLTYTAPITMDMLMDAAFDMETEIISDGAEAFAFQEGNRFILGTGVKQPSGFLEDTRVTDTFINSETAGTLTATDILKVTGNLKTGYNPTFVLNRRTLALLRTEKATTGQFIWQPGINGVVENTLAGIPYVIANDMPDVSAGNFAVAFGDFMRGYLILDRTGLSIIRDDVTQARNAIVNFTMNRWNTGQVVLPEAITGVQIS